MIQHILAGDQTCQHEPKRSLGDGGEKILLILNFGRTRPDLVLCYLSTIDLGDCGRL